MQFIINRESLNHAIQDVSRAVAARTTIPILTGIKMVVTDNEIILTASNSDISIECTIPVEKDGEEIAQITKTGSIVIPEKYFGEIIKRLPREEVEIQSNPNHQVMIRSGSSEFNLNGLDPEEFPRLPQLVEEKVITIPADILKNMIHQTSFAVATSETRPILTGVKWALQDGKLNIVATDSHRLASREVPVETNDDLSFDQIVIPGKSLTELIKILDETDQPVDIIITDNQILFKYKYILFFSRLLDGTYPDTSRIIPNTFMTRLTLDTKGFLQAIERASLIAGNANKNVVKVITQPDGNIEVMSMSQEVGRVTETVTPSSIEGDELKISFNARYMIDALRSIDSEEVQIGFTGAMSPFIIRPTDHQEITQLIVPVRTN